eukprot:Colp12_sorted_trinity150504_noHs@27067
MAVHKKNPKQKKGLSNSKIALAIMLLGSFIGVFLAVWSDAKIDEFSAKQYSNNKNTRQSWNLFESHRRIVTREILDLLARSSDAFTEKSILVLGAGNVNDVNLDSLSRKSSITLLDIDGHAMQHGIDYQTKMGSMTMQQRESIRSVVADATGFLQSSLSNLKTTSDLLKYTQHLPAEQEHFMKPQYSVVASICLLSQLVLTVTDRVKDGLISKGVEALRQQHLRVMIRNLAPGGWAILVSDVVSSQSLPELETVKDDMLPKIMEKAISNFNFFSGTNPYKLVNELRETFSEFVQSVEMLKPWRWHFMNNPKRIYLVYAVRFRKRLTS